MVSLTTFAKDFGLSVYREYKAQNGVGLDESRSVLCSTRRHQNMLRRTIPSYNPPKDSIPGLASAMDALNVSLSWDYRPTPHDNIYRLFASDSLSNEPLNFHKEKRRATSIASASTFDLFLQPNLQSISTLADPTLARAELVDPR